MGFCLFNNAAVAARYAQNENTASRRGGDRRFSTCIMANGSAGDILVRPHCDVRLDSSDAALPRHRRGERARASTTTIVNAPLRPGVTAVRRFVPPSRR